MKSKNIVYVEKNVAKLIEEDVRPLNKGEVLVRLQVFSISSRTECANLTGSTSKSVASKPVDKAHFSRRGAHTSARPDSESYSGWWSKSDDMNALVQFDWSDI